MGESNKRKHPYLPNFQMGDVPEPLCTSPHAHLPLPPALSSPFLLLCPLRDPGHPQRPLGQKRIPPLPLFLASARPSLISWFINYNSVPTCSRSLRGGRGLGSLSYLELTNGPSLPNYIISSLRVGFWSLRSTLGFNAIWPPRGCP